MGGCIRLFEDLRIGPEILKHQADAYRRLRNTELYLLGNLDGFDENESVSVEDMPELEQFVLHRVCELDGLVRRCCNDYDFHTLFTELHNFCTVELSAFYFDIRKDALYCNPADDPTRRAVRTVLDTLFSCLTAWLAPIICFTAEEAWHTRYPDRTSDDSVHLRLFPEIPETWHNEALAEKWQRVRNLRRVVTGALEIERAAKRIGSSLAAAAIVYTSSEDRALLDGIDAADLFITSAAQFPDGKAPGDAFSLPEIPGVQVIIKAAAGEKCARCWKVLPEIGAAGGHDELCHRCVDAVGGLVVS